MSKGNWKKKEKNWVEQTNHAATKWRNVREVNERRYKSDEDVKFFKQDQVSDKGCFATCFWHLVPGSSCYFAKVKPRNIHVYIGVVAVALEFRTTVPIISHASIHISADFPPSSLSKMLGKYESSIASIQQVSRPFPCKEGNLQGWDVHLRNRFQFLGIRTRETLQHVTMPCPHIIQRKSKVLIRFHLASLGPSRWIQVEAIRMSSGPPVHTSLSVRITWPRASISPSATWHGAWFAHLED